MRAAIGTMRGHRAIGKPSPAALPRREAGHFVGAAARRGGPGPRRGAPPPSEPFVRLLELDRAVAEQTDALGVDVEEEQAEDAEQDVGPQVLRVVDLLVAR